MYCRVLRRRGDEGSALVLTLAVLMLTALMATAIVASTIYSTRSTTATRANVQAVAAAEAGAQLVAKGLIEGTITCSGSYESPAGSIPEYEVVVDYVPKGALGAAWTTGCPPQDVTKLRIRSTGYAQSKGVGNSTRDEARTEILFQRPAPQPRFNKALFGDLNISVNTGVDVSQEGSYTADLYTNGNYTCSTQSAVEGSLFVKGNVTFSSEPCHLYGDVYVEGSFTCAAGTQIDGNLYVQGNVNFTGLCNVGGDLWAGGNLSASHGGGPTTVGGNLLVRGNMNLNPPLESGGEYRAGGTMTFTHSGARTSFLATHPHAVENDPTVGMPPTIPASPDHAFPKIFPDGRVGSVGSNEVSAESIWEGWASGNWKNAVEAVSGNQYANHCSPWNAPFNSPITINENTVMDTRTTCGGGIILTPGMKFLLNADLVVLANQIGVGSGGEIRVSSGDGKVHNLYLIVPWPVGQVNCVDSPQKVSLTGDWRQDDKIKVMVYSPADLLVNGNPTIRGQVYGCRVSAHTAFKIEYLPVGDLAEDETLASLRLAYMRDVTS